MTRPMKLPPGTTLAVALHWGAETQLPVGRMAMRDRRVLFEFDAAFLKEGVDISPLHLPRQPGVIETHDALFETLPGVFNDSLPDGWGRLLLDRDARRNGVAPETLTPLDRLAHVGRDGMGALVYLPEFAKDEAEEAVDLDEVAASSRAVLDGTSDEVLEHLRKLGGSPQGARPKALVQIENATGRVTDALHDRGPGWRQLIVKFAAQEDVADIGPVELAYSRMAAAAGVKMPETLLLSSVKGHGYFAAVRFDRQGGQRVHVATASGLLHADHRLPSLDYVTLAKLAVRLSHDHREGEALFRLMAFNVLAHNRDDHAKQLSFLLDRAGGWTLAPAYDLTFSRGPGGEHTTSVAGEGRAPSTEAMLKVGDAAGLKRGKAGEILEQTRLAVRRWPEFAEAAAVTVRTAVAIWETVGRLAARSQ